MIGWPTTEPRIYHSLGELLTDLRAITSRQKVIRSLMRGKTFHRAFRGRDLCGEAWVAGSSTAMRALAAGVQGG
jgi:hypothetical protein